LLLTICKQDEWGFTDKKTADLMLKRQQRMNTGKKPAGAKRRPKKSGLPKAVSAWGSEVQEETQEFQTSEPNPPTKFPAIYPASR
jgi:hypothetical protein